MPTWISFFILFVFISFAEGKTSHSTLAIAIPDVAPFGYMDQDDTLKGLYFDVFKRIEKASELNFEYTLYPYARLKTSLSNDRPDLVILFAPLCELHKELYEVQQRFKRLSVSLFLKANADSKSKDLKMARVRGTCLTFMDGTIKPENIIEVADFKQAVSMLQLGRIDGVCALNLVYEFNIKKHPEFTEKMVRFKTGGQSLDFEPALCRRKDLPQASKLKLEKAVKSIDPSIE